MTTLRYDPEFAKALEPLRSNRPSGPPQTALEIRRNNDFLFENMFPKAPSADIIQQTDYTIQTYDGADILLRRFAKPEHLSAKEPLPAVLAIHGGGFVSGSVDVCAGLVASKVLAADRPIFAVDYRLAPEHPHPTPVEDSYAALKYILDHAVELNIDPKRVAVQGESAGGGIAAGLALLARDRELQPPIAKLLVTYPQIDDRTRYAEETEFLKFATYSPKHNELAWAAYVGDDKAGKPEADVSPYAAPARAATYRGLPSTCVDVGTLDMFREENMEFVRRLLADDVEVEFHIWPGVPHAFEFLGAGTKWHVRATEVRVDAMKEF
ncbi:hypothetical protein CEP54_004337 [Fusarium duplospermum]|uniref:Alpha/beta hydrolase fold-3 domain-containing protein n=1 Tax=Fusarium duplospermum TaxID=1325734 RepID=A0A428QIW4_9HYPO|nr:hypothetical protein CEP54_004337 [Fusarium duplospermum]